jgi:GAF domain-containing protein
MDDSIYPTMDHDALFTGGASGKGGGGSTFGGSSTMGGGTHATSDTHDATTRGGVGVTSTAGGHNLSTLGMGGGGGRSYFGGTSSDMDLRTVVKATQAISSEIELSKLLHTLMTILIRNAGAEQGILLSRETAIHHAKRTEQQQQNPSEQAGLATIEESGEGGPDPSASPNAAQSPKAAAGDEQQPQQAAQARAKQLDLDARVRRRAREAEEGFSSSSDEDEDDHVGPLANAAGSTSSNAGSVSSTRVARSGVAGKLADDKRRPLGLGGSSNDDDDELGAWMVEATAAVDGGEVKVSTGQANTSGVATPGMATASGASPSVPVVGTSLAAGGLLTSAQSRALYPLSIFNFVVHTKKSVILSDAFSDRRFGRDPYIVSRKTKSLLCMPLIHRDKLVSVIFLENNMSPATFSSERLVVCRLLTQQAAISIDNARLYAQQALTNQTLELHVKLRTKQLEEAMRDAHEANKAKSSFLTNSQSHTHAACGLNNLHTHAHHFLSCCLFLSSTRLLSLSVFCSFVQCRMKFERP